MTAQPTLPEIPPKPRRKMLQPTKDALRELITNQHATIERQGIEIARLLAEVETLRTSWFPRLTRRKV